jgi:tRNA(His) 5'-end guanylyltransferase
LLIVPTWFLGLGRDKLTVFIGHINNLYNTTFWTLILKGGMDAKEAEKELAVGSPTPSAMVPSERDISTGNTRSRQERNPI